MSCNLTTVTGEKDLEFITDSFVKVLAYCLMEIKQETGSWELLVRTSLCHFIQKVQPDLNCTSLFGSHYFKRYRNEKVQKKVSKCQHFSCK